MNPISYCPYIPIASFSTSHQQASEESLRGTGVTVYRGLGFRLYIGGYSGVLWVCSGLYGL